MAHELAAAEELCTVESAAPIANRAEIDADLDQMLIRVATQDHQAFAELYDVLGSLVFGISLKVICNPSLAEEASQETFIQIWRKAATFDPAKGKARTWVATVAHRRAVDTVRHEQNVADRELRVPWDRGPAFDVVVETADANSERLQVRASLANLTALQRESIGLAFYGGLTYLEVAHKLGVKHATVKTRMRDGLVQLQDNLCA